jgi:DNA-binding LacI/PurR family transcriptional regulator
VNKRPTIADIARMCSVTPATVSRILNNNSNFSSSPEVRQKILDTAAQVGYRPDISARNLSKRNSHVIGLFASPHTHLADGINESLLVGITETLHAAGYDLFYGLSRRQRTKNPIPFWRFEGAVLMQAPRPSTVEELDSRHVPYVCVNERLGSPAACVLADDVAGMKSILQHLNDLDHELVAYANAPDFYFPHHSMEDRHKTLVEHAPKLGMRLAPGHDQAFNVHAPAKFVRAAVVESNATAIIAYDHQVAFLILGAAHGMGMRIPQDFSLVCFNDVFPMAAIYPPLTTVAVPGREMGRMAAEILLEDLSSPKPQKAREFRLTEHLIVRGSTAGMGEHKPKR